MRLPCRRAQINSIDLMVAIFLFAAMLVFLFAFWQNTAASAKRATIRNGLEYYAAETTDMMVKSAGLPANWELAPGSARAAGLAYAPNVLYESKVAAFASLPYSNASRLIGARQAEFYFWVEDANGTRLYEAGNATTISDTTVSVTRYAHMKAYGGASVPVRLRLTFYAR